MCSLKGIKLPFHNGFGIIQTEEYDLVPNIKQAQNGNYMKEIEII